ncbi:sigma-w pathway protein ysdB [Microaerobacter geothermalis]|uniref:sigma-w pathway protein ysdB n=1 Tax=Microaerobacter geothermalis TaxID=674972 RepID=UPI001F48D250|nr:sigma-w pathway protein ysdB [Microaerobacter geothermalis]MCF6092488.1 sigma-w pathway protein ysdB [Microaerobacter geothermalis]
MGILIRVLLFIAIIYFAYRWIRYLFDPKRKLEIALDKKTPFFLDDPNHVRKNFSIAYKGVLFEGEKYLGTTERAFTVVSVFVWVKNPNKLKGFEKEDFYEIEKMITEHYPYADIEWKNPIKDFLHGIHS